MKVALTILCLCLVTTVCPCQSKRNQKTKEIKIDTIDIFQRFDNKTFREKNVFWSDRNEIGIIHKQWFDTLTPDAGYSIELTIIFYDWDSVELDKDYDLVDFKSEFQIKGGYSPPETFSKPHGLIRLIAREKESLTFHFDVDVLSKSGDKHLTYKGEREFKSDY